MTCLLLSRSPASSRVSLTPTFFGTRIKVPRSAMQRESMEMDESQALRSLRAWETFQVSFPASQICQTRAITLPICVTRNVVCVPNNHEHNSRVSFLVCLSVFACTPVHNNSPTTSTHSLACFAGALTDNFRTLVCRKTCAARLFDPDTEHTRVPRGVHDPAEKESVALVWLALLASCALTHCEGQCTVQRT